MAKIKTQKEIDAAIVDCFKANADADKLLVTEDGCCFLEKNRGSADYHARREGLPKYKTVERRDYDVPATVKKENEEPGYDKMTVKDLKAELEKREIQVPSKANKEDLINLLDTDDKAKEEKTGEGEGAGVQEP